MFTPQPQEWISRVGDKKGTERHDYLEELREQLFDTMAQKTVGRHFKNKGNKRELSELRPSQLVLYWLTGYERLKLKAYRSVKQKPMWSAPCRIKGKTKNRTNTYDITPLWGKQITIIKPRDVLMEIPSNWDETEATLATKEMRADIKYESTNTDDSRPIDRSDLEMNPDKFVRLLFSADPSEEYEELMNGDDVCIIEKPDCTNQVDDAKRSSKQHENNYEECHCVDTDEVMKWLYNCISDKEVDELQL